MMSDETLSSLQLARPSPLGGGGLRFEDPSLRGCCTSRRLFGGGVIGGGRGSMARKFFGPMDPRHGHS